MSRHHDSPASPDSALAAARAQIRSLRAQLADAQARAAEAEHQTRGFRELAEHIREVFWMTNALGDELVYVSPAYEHIWGQPCSSLYEDPGRRLAWVHEDDRERVLVAFKRDAADGHYDETFRICRPDDEIRWIRDRAFPIYDESGEIYRLAGFAIDLTAHIQHQEQVVEIRDRIAMRERMSVLATAGGGLTHELGQPLTSAQNFIRGALSVARRKDRGLTDLLEAANHQIQRAGSIVRHLRRFAQEGTPTLTRQALLPILNEVRVLMAPRLRSERIACEWPGDGELAAIEISADRIFTQLVLCNLIGNAIDALAQTPIATDARRIALSIANHDDWLDIYVADNGGGIGTDVALFSPFASTKEAGLGMGLFMSRSLARSFGGDLSLIRNGREAGATTCFMLRLPHRVVPAA